jgi:DNA ligase-associated metallophosphoesterase
MQLKLSNILSDLLPEKALWIQSFKALIVADLHLGKAEFFQENGIPIPTSVHGDDLKRLQFLIDKFLPENLYVLGDLFHHGNINGNVIFKSFCEHNINMNIVWIIGNHDKQSDFNLQNLCVKNYEILDKLYFTHEPIEKDGFFVIAGHEHPAVKIKSGLDSLKFPCFVSIENTLILPSFGSFTGNKVYLKTQSRLKEKTNFYAIVKNNIVKI